MKLIRRSEIVDFMRCRKAWDYRWQQNLEPARPDGKLFFGNLFHKFIETYYNNECDPFEALKAMLKLFKETDTSRMEQLDLDDMWDLAVKVTDNYVDQWQHIDSTWQVIATELTFAIPLDGDLYYTGTIDLIYKEEGKLKFMDHKSGSSIERYVSKVEMDTQISNYWWALEQLGRGNGLIYDKNIDDWHDVKSEWCRWFPKGLEPTEFIYNIILRDTPEPPEPLKKGGLSKAKAQKTTYKVYLQALVDHSLSEVEYSDILDHFIAQETEHGNRFFRRIPVTRNEHQIQSAMGELLSASMDIDVVKGFMKLYEQQEYGINPIYRNPTHDCSWCNYRSICLAEMDGVNADLVRNTLYKQKELTP